MSTLIQARDETPLAVHEVGTGPGVLCVPGGPGRASAYLENLGGLDESDPRSMARWMRKMGKELGEDAGEDFDQMVDELEAGGDDEDSDAGSSGDGDDV